MQQKIVEDVLKKEQLPIKREALKRKLERRAEHHALNIILRDLEDSGKIIDAQKGIAWVYNPSEKLDKAIKNGLRL